METVKTEHVTITYDEASDILLLSWHHFTPSQEYREALEKALQMMVKHKVKKWIFDQRFAEVISPSDQQWVVEDWTPRVISKVGKGARSAVILAKNIFGELGIKKLVDTTREAVTTKYFETVDNAKKWLKEEA